MQQTVDNTVVELIQGDITEMETDAIVNATNTRLQHGGGVAGAIVRQVGDIIQNQSNRIGTVPVGQAAKPVDEAMMHSKIGQPLILRCPSKKQTYG